MVDAEAQRVQAEYSEYLKLSDGDLTQELYDLQVKWNVADHAVRSLICRLPEHEALAFHCLLVRDLFLLMELYRTCLKTATDALSGPAAVPRIQTPGAVIEHGSSTTGWLFEPIE
jgi:hypothetical protein